MISKSWSTQSIDNELLLESSYSSMFPAPVLQPYGHDFSTLSKVSANHRTKIYFDIFKNLIERVKPVNV